MKKLLIIFLLFGLFSSCVPHTKFNYSSPKNNRAHNVNKNAKKKLSYSTPKRKHKYNVIKDANEKLSYKSRI
jgi:hypothetical protein